MSPNSCLPQPLQSYCSPPIKKGPLDSNIRFNQNKNCCFPFICYCLGFFASCDTSSSAAPECSNFITSGVKSGIATLHTVILVGRILVDFNHEVLPVRVMNMTAITQKIKKGSDVAKCELVDAVVGENENALTRTCQWHQARSTSQPHQRSV